MGGLRLAPASNASTASETETNSDEQSSTAAADASSLKPSIRQVHSDTRFPQRKKPGHDSAAPVLEPTSTDKLIAGIWRQVFSPVRLNRVPSVSHTHSQFLSPLMQRSGHRAHCRHPHRCQWRGKLSAASSTAWFTDHPPGLSSRQHPLPQILQPKPILPRAGDDRAGVLDRMLPGPHRRDPPRKPPPLNDGGPDGRAEGGLRNAHLERKGSSEPGVSLPTQSRTPIA